MSLRGALFSRVSETLLPERLPALQPHEVVRALHAAVRLQHFPCQDCLSSVAEHLQHRLHELQVTQLVETLTATSVLRFRGKQFLQALYRETRARLSDMSCHQNCATLHALGALSCPDGALLNSACSLLQTELQCLNVSDLARLLCSLHNLNLQGPLMDAAAKSLLPQLRNLDAHQLLRVVHVLVLAGFGHDVHVDQCWAAERWLWNLRPMELGHLVCALFFLRLDSVEVLRDTGDFRVDQRSRDLVGVWRSLRLAGCTHDRLWEAVRTQALHLWTTMSPLETTRTLHSFALLRVAPRELLSEVSANTSLGELGPRELSTAVFSLGVLRMNNDRILLSASLGAEKVLDHLTANDTARLLQGMSRLKCMDSRVAFLVQGRAQNFLGEFNANDLTETLWAAIKSRRCHHGFLSGVCHHSTLRLGEFTLDGLLQIIVMLSRLLRARRQPEVLL